MQGFTRSTIVGLVLLLLLGEFTRAVVVPVAWYKLGEDDPGAVANTPGQDPTRDNTANNLDLTRNGTPTYRADTAALALNSTLSMQLNGTSDYYARNAPVTTATANVGIEVWAKPDAAAAPSIAGYVDYNGTGGVDGYGFIQGGNGLHSIVPALSDTHWYALVGASFIDMGPVTSGQWVHLGLAIDSSGNVSVYEDGTLVTTVSESINAPTADFQIGAYAPSPQQYFAGEVDEARVFTFSGTFNPSDFLIPEPSSLMLLASGAAMLLYRRRQ